ncbi:MAG: hypothetical protein WCY30_00125 [Candidatus Neomarinimicrobiota bacterium]|jgi:hypothetical protein
MGTTQPLVKRLNFSPINVLGEPQILYVPKNMDKIASEMNPEIVQWIDSNQNTNGNERIISTALGAYDGYSANINGDGFYERHLLAVPKDVFLNDKPYHRPMYMTFVDFSKLYKNHLNRPHNQSFGVIPFSSYNNRMRRVETVIDLFTNDNINQEILDDLDVGIFPAQSMGFRCIPGDVCSICLNYEHPFPSRSDYCDHLRNHMLQYDQKSGRLIFAINHNGYFFDLSIVRRPADRIAYGMVRVIVPSNYKSNAVDASVIKRAGAQGFAGYSSKYAEDRGDTELVNKVELKLKEEDKVAVHDIFNVIKSDPDPEFRQLGANLIIKTDTPIDKEALDYFASNYSLNDIVSTFAGVGIIPTTQEFQRLVLTNIGMSKVADLLDSDGYVFTADHTTEPNNLLDCNKSEINTKLASEMRSMGILDKRSYYSQFLMQRAVMIKEALDGGDFFKRFPILKNPIPIQKYPEDYQQRLIASGISASPVGQYYQRYPNPVLSDGRYISAKPEGATVMYKNNPLIPLALLGSLYVGAKWITGFSKGGPLGKLMSKNPAFAAGAFGAAAVLSWAIGRIGIPKTEKMSSIGSGAAKAFGSLGKDYMLHILSGIALSYGVAARAEKKREIGVQPNIIENMFEKKPGLGAAIMAMTIGGVLNIPKKFASAELENLEHAIAINDHIIGEYPPDYIDKMARESLNRSAVLLLSKNKSRSK